MGNRQAYKSAWKRHRDNVVRIRREHDRKMAEISGYAGSKLGDERIQAENGRFSEELRAAREKFGEEMSPVFKGMSDRIRTVSEQVVPPSSEMLAILAAVHYREKMDVNEYLAYLNACEGSVTAQLALWDMALSRTGAKLEKPRGNGAKLSAILEELRLSARLLGEWDGASTGGLPAKAGQIDPTSPEFERQAVGMKFDDGLMALLD